MKLVIFQFYKYHTLACFNISLPKETSIKFMKIQYEASYIPVFFNYHTVACSDISLLRVIIIKFMKISG